MSKAKGIVFGLTLVVLCGIVVGFLFFQKVGMEMEPALDDAGITYQYCKAYEYANYYESEAMLNAIAHGRYNFVDVSFQSNRAGETPKSVNSELINVVSTEELKSMLHALRKTENELSVTIWDFDIDPEMIEALGSISKLRTLFLGYCRFDCNFKKLPGKDCIFSLTLHRSQAKSDWQTVFHDVVDLSELKIFQCEMLPEDIQSILNGNTKLRYLEMRGMDIDIPPNFSQWVSSLKNWKRGVALHGVTIGTQEIENLLKVPYVPVTFCDITIKD